MLAVNKSVVGLFGTDVNSRIQFCRNNLCNELTHGLWLKRSIIFPSTAKSKIKTKKLELVVGNGRLDILRILDIAIAILVFWDHWSNVYRFSAINHLCAAPRQNIGPKNIFGGKDVFCRQASASGHLCKKSTNILSGSCITDPSAG